MSEVEKMYENAGIVPDCEHGECGLDYCPNNYGCGYAFYPEFTAEKQIELTQKMWELRPNIYPNFDLLVNYSYGEMIAKFVNNRWQDLTEEERKQIKEILE